MYAVIRTGGKQYRVAAEDVIEIERTGAGEGDVIEFSDVLMVAGDGAVEIGTPLVAGALVAAEVVKLSRGPRIIVFKKKRRKHYRRRNGHRQDLMQVRIAEILTGGKKPSKAARPKAEPAAEAKAADEVKAETKPAKPEKAAAKPEKADAPAVKDDLTLIGGVGPALKKKLEGAGITSLGQLAAMPAEELAALDETLKLGGRSEREDWAGQARDLLAGKPPRAKVDQAKSDS